MISGWAVLGVLAAFSMAILAASTYRCRKCHRTGNVFWGAFHLHRK